MANPVAMRMRGIVQGATSFALDWKHKRIFWSNQYKGIINWTHMSGKRSLTLLRGLVHPTFISVDPVEGLLFWASGYSFSSIERSSLNGSNVTTVIILKGEVKALALDISEKRIYWAVAEVGAAALNIGACFYYGEVAAVVKYLGMSWRQSMMGLSVFHGDIYYPESKSASIKRIYAHTGKDSTTIFLRSSTTDITDLKLVPQQTTSQISGPDLCIKENDHCTRICQSDAVGQQCKCTEGFQLSTDGRYCEDINECALWTHGCTLGCENVPGSYYCTCPRGYVLLPDNKSCHDMIPCLPEGRNCSYGCVQTSGGPACFCPEESVLARDGKTCTGCSSPDNGGCSQICQKSRVEGWKCDCFPGYTLQWDKKRCLAAGPRPFLLFTNVQDIRRMNFDGTHYDRLLDIQIGRVFALDYDPVQNRIYFAHTALKCIESAKMDGSERKLVISQDVDALEGLAVDAINRKLYWTDRGKARIERSDLNGENKATIIHEKLHQPRGICVHPRAGRVYWTEMGSSPQIGSSSLEGRERRSIVSTNLVWPSGITVDILTDKLYWCDAHRSVIESSHLDGSNRQTLSHDVGHPFGIAVFEDHIWVSDWLQPSIIRVDRKFPHSLVRLRGSMQRPSALVVVHPLTKLAIADIMLEPRKDVAVSNATTPNQSFLHGPLSTMFYGSVTRQNAHSSNELVTHIFLSDESGCAGSQCDINAHCVPSDNGPRCQCLEGYTGNGKSCHDVDECFSHLDACDPHSADCINMEGGYICRCKDGFLGNGVKCKDIDECALSTHGCGDRFLCTNTPGNYTCTCNNGIPGTAANCTELSATASTFTRNINNINNSVAGKGHAQECPEFDDEYCFNGGMCIYFPDLEEYACICVAGYLGYRCQHNDLQWSEPRSTQMRIRSVTIAVSLIVLFLTLGLGSFAIYHYRHQNMQSRNAGGRHMET
ncbi:pro-epidermal growth factor isoform X2 [Hyperolius riggenbachi]|uniref:pro-epidermal growth factor isoform X2 n=1 Tax=Hyperolius riggenbachi TaxID=752182 RepID=UPI0035A364BF